MLDDEGTKLMQPRAWWKSMTLSKPKKGSTVTQGRQGQQPWEEDASQTAAQVTTSASSSSASGVTGGQQTIKQREQQQKEKK